MRAIWHRVAALGDIPADAALAVSVEDIAIALYRVGDVVHAVSDICTHEYVRLSAGAFEHGVIECPAHHARFEVATGRCVGRPAMRDLETWDVRIEDGAVLVRAPA